MMIPDRTKRMVLAATQAILDQSFAGDPNGPRTVVKAEEVAALVGYHVDYVSEAAAAVARDECIRWRSRSGDLITSWEITVRGRYALLCGTGAYS